MKSFKILNSETLIDEPYCHIEKQQVVLPNGDIINWFIRHSGPAVVIIPQLKSGEIYLQKTYKHGCGKVIVEFPAGLVDTGEKPLISAIRELREETGLIAEEMTFLGQCAADATGSNMTYYFFFAKNCEKVSKQKLDDAEQIESFLVKDLASAQKELLYGKYKTTASSLSALGMVLK